MDDDFDYDDVSPGVALLAFLIVAALGIGALAALDGLAYIVDNM